MEVPTRQATLDDYEVDRSPFGTTHYVMEVRLTKNDEEGVKLDGQTREFELDRGFAAQTPGLEERSFRSRNDITNDVLDKFIRHAVHLMISHRDDWAEWQVVSVEVEEREKIRKALGFSEYSNIEIKRMGGRDD